MRNNEVVHAEPACEGQRNEPEHIQTQPAFAIHVSEPAGILPIRVPLVCTRVMDSPLIGPRRAKVITKRNKNLHCRNTEVTESGVEAERGTLNLLRVEEADVTHGRCKVTTTETREERTYLEQVQAVYLYSATVYRQVRTV